MQQRFSMFSGRASGWRLCCYRLAAAILSVCVVPGCAPPRKPVTIDAPVAVTIDPDVGSSNRRVVPVPVQSFWEGMRNLDPDYAKRNPVSADEARFADALRMIMTGEVNDAELLLDSLRSNTSDSLVHTGSWLLLTAMLQYQDKWNLIAEIAPKRTLPPGTERNRASVEEWAAALSKVPKRVVNIPSRPSTTGLALSMAGTPVISVLLNGKQRFFWIDTGASISIVSSDVAAEAGMTALSPDTLEIVTATGRIPALPSMISRLDFGGVSVINAKAMIVNVDLMTVRTLDDRGPPLSIRIDGIVGFDILRLLKMRLDYSRGTVTFSEATPLAPRAAARIQRNFFWVGTPIVRLLTPRGVPLHFVLDTGAQETYATETLPFKARVRPIPGERRSVHGLAGELRFRGVFIRALELWLGNRRLDIERLLIFAPAVSSFTTIDGILGSDITRTGIVTLDPRNGLLTIEAPSRRALPSMD